MALRNKKSTVFRAKGLSDSLDGTNSFPGSMQSLANLVLSPNNASIFVPRVAATEVSIFPGFDTPGIVSALQIIGTLAFGMLSTNRTPGYDEPFLFDLETQTFITISGVTATNVPNTPNPTGDWVPPTIAQPSPGRTIFTHPGFAGTGSYFGWIDTSNFSLTSIKGNITNGSPVIRSITGDVTSAPIADGVQPGQTITGVGIPIGATVVSAENGIFDLATTGNANGTTALASVANLTGVEVGMYVTGPLFAAGTYVAALPGGGGVTLSTAALGTATGTVAIFTGGGTITISANATATTPLLSLTIAGGTPASPLWGAGNTNTNPLFAVPVAVTGFNGRAWYAVENYAVFSDVLNSTQVTNASQALALDSTHVTALAGNPLTSQLTGGIVQALIIFKGADAPYQITGDAATSNLTQNLIAGGVGTLSPRTICETPLGLAYVAPDGVRIIGPNALVSDPVGDYGKGVTVPFINALYPTRMCAAFNHNTMKISVQNGGVLSQPFQDYWLNFGEKVWTGPHTFTASAIGATSVLGATVDFVFATNAVPGTLWSQSVVPAAAAEYTENGVPLAWTWAPSLLPDNNEGAMNALIQTTLAVALSTAQNCVIDFYDENGVLLDEVVLGVGTAGSPTVWDAFNWDGAGWDFTVVGSGSTGGAFNWGAGNWGGQSGPFEQLPIEWHNPIVFKQGRIVISGSSYAGFAIGNLYMNYEVLGYMLQRRLG